ncbi:MAG: diguanylate cyclase [Bryobacterales bacterium]|nr:diguanylate cyclase [Bryobacterales bacterium]
MLETVVETMRVVIAEDSGPSRLALERTLAKWGYEVIACKDGNAAWEELEKEHSPNLAILDWMMPGYSGPEIVRMVRAKAEAAKAPYTYILLLTSKNERADLIEGLEAGADDYITKPFDQQELRVRLRAGVRILNLQAELVAAREALRDQAMRDALTGLWNRRSIIEILTREQSRAARQTMPVGVLMMDIDHFKDVNDTHGHLAGDDVLKEVSRRLLASVRPYDGVGRYGGEEFIIVLPGCDVASIQSRGEAMRLAIADQPITAYERQLSITASFGATVFIPPSTLDVADLIRTADDALYEAKRRGRNCVIYQSSPVPENAN